MNTSPQTDHNNKVLRPCFTQNALLYTISRHKLGMSTDDAAKFVEACVRFATERPDPTPEAA